MKNRLTRGVRACIVFLSVVAGVCVISAEAQADWGADFIWYPTSDPSAVGTCIAGEPTTFEGKETGDPPLGTRTQYIWKFAGCTMNDTCPHGSGAQTTTWTLPEVNPNNKVILQIKNGDDYRQVFKTVPVTGNAFTVNVLPSAGCTVMAGDGGVDDDVDNDPNGNGINCSTTTPDADKEALCTEQFQNSNIAALKVVPEPGYELAYWEMNGGIIQQASAEPLFLSTMPMLAGVVPIPATTNTATMKAHCLSLSLESVTFEGMSAELLQDNGTPYPGPTSTPPQPHWKKTDDASYRPTPVVFTSGSTMTAKVKFTVEPADFSGEIYVTGLAEVPLTIPETPLRYVVFAPQKADVTNGVASVTIPCSTMFPENTVDIFDPMRITWGYGMNSGPFHDAGTSENQVYVTRDVPATSPLYHTLVHLGCKNGKGETTEKGVIEKVWEEFRDNEVYRLDGEQFKYWHEGAASAETTAELLGDSEANGQCGSWAEFFIDMLKVQNILATKITVLEKSAPRQRSFLVKDWLLAGAGVSPASSPYTYVYMRDAFDLDGVEGQGNENPPGGFRNHFIVKHIEQFYDPVSGEMREVTRFYDPSYGSGPFYSHNEWENASLDGFTKKGIFEGTEAILIKKNDPDVEETLFQ